MNKLFTKIATAFVGMAMAIGVGVAVGNNSVRQAKADDPTYNGVQYQFGTSAPTGWTLSASVTGASGYAKLKSGDYTYRLSSALFTSGKYLSTDMTIDIACGTFGTWSGTKSVTVTASFLNGNGNSISSKEQTYSSLNSTEGTYRGAFSLGMPDDPQQIAQLRIDFSIPNASDVLRFKYVKLTYSEAAPSSVHVTNLSLDKSNHTLDSKNKNFSETITATVTATGGDHTGVTWATSNSNVVKIVSSTSTTCVVSPFSNGSATITATTKERTSDTNLQLVQSITITVSNFVAEKGEFGNPYSVAEAKAAIDASSGTTGVYTLGIISQIDSYSSKYHSITYWISDDGTTTDQIEVYGGLGLNGAEFSSESDLTVGQMVIVFGNIKKYNDTYEYDTNSQIAQFIEVTPTKTLISWNDGKGTYYNGTIQNTYRFSTSHITVKSADADNHVKESFGSGTGFVAKIYKNGSLIETLTATSSVQTFDFKDKDATSPSVVWTIKATVGELAESTALTINVTNREPSSYEWTTARSATLYSHRDVFNPNEGALKISFNDTGSATAWSNFNYSIHAYDEDAENHLGNIVSVPAHTNGTINLSSETKYVLNYWHKSYESGLHCYFVVTVKIPTLQISDNYAGDYYVGVNRVLDVTVTPYYGEEAGTALSSSEYVLKVNSSVVTSLTPENTDAISVYAAWVIDENEVLTTATPLNITPIESSRVLGDMTIDNQTFTAGSFFTLGANSILVEVNDGTEYLDQGDVTFETEGGVILTSNIRLLKSYAGTITASYAEGTGEGKETQTTFTLTVNDPVISSYTAPVIADNATQITSVSVGDTVYLVCTGGKVQFSGMSTSGTSRGLGTSYTTNIDNSVGKFEIVAGSETNTFAFKFFGETKYLAYTGSSNSLATDTTVVKSSSWTITFNSGNAVIKNANSTTRQLYWNSDRFACYTNAQTAVQLFKRAVTPGTGDAVEYLKSVIDYYRLKSETTVDGEGLSVCSAGNSIFGTSEWTKAKGVFSNLTSAQRTELSVQDYFGEEGKTYVQTYEWLIAKDPANQSSKTSLSSLSKDNASIIIVVVSMISISALGAFLFLKKRKEQ